MLHLETEWPSKQNVLIAATILEKSGPLPDFKVWGSKLHFQKERFLFLSYF